MSDWTPGTDLEADGCMALVLVWVLTLMGGIAIGFWLLK